MTHRRTHYRSSRRSYSPGLILAILAGGLACVLLVVSSALFAPAEVADRQAARDPVGVSRDTRDEAAARQAGAAVYPYSVVPGGVHSAAALAEAIHDPVVASHYAAIDIAHARVERVTAPRRAYVSYRVNDQVFWTRHMVALHEGETILSDGVHEIRARCGNRIADTPQEPTQASEPEIAEFDRALAPAPGPVPMLMASNAPNGGVVPIPPLSAIGDVNGDAPAPGFPGLPAGATRTQSNGLGDEAVTSSGTPGAGVFPGGGVPVLPTLHDTPGGDGGSPLIPFDEPIVPIDGEPGLTPVPEPDSLLLLASGIAGCALHAWRRRRR
jgi:hypothetical protein